MLSQLFPAILIAGPPHSGKSVLGFLLSLGLRELGIAHYLLKADPAGEGDWFQWGQAEQVRLLRQKAKGQYSYEFVQRVSSVIQNRLLPLLVDAGGAPRGDQFDIWRACTHSILLYRSGEELQRWQGYLARQALQPLAVLRSTLTEAEKLEPSVGELRGVISGLERHAGKTGLAFGALLDRVSGICRYEAAYLERVHRKHAPYPFLAEADLACQLGAADRQKAWLWQPEQLGAIAQTLPRGQAWAIYGRGPVWLAATLAAHAYPAPIAFFDARFGWLEPPPVFFGESGHVKVQITPWTSHQALWAAFQLVEAEIEPEAITIPPIPGRAGLVLSGKLPRWYFAALARALAAQKAWIAIHDPAAQRAIVVHSNHLAYPVGTTMEV